MAEVLRTEQMKLVAVSGAANVTGWMPPIHEIADVWRIEHGALICVDGAQLMAHAPGGCASARATPDTSIFITAAGHKMYAPFGIGFLYGPRASSSTRRRRTSPEGGTAVRGRVPIRSQWLPSPDRHQGGTPNVAGVIGLASVIDFLSETVGMDRIREHELRLLSKQCLGRSSGDRSGITLYGPPSLRGTGGHPHVQCRRA